MTLLQVSIMISQKSWTPGGGASFPYIIYIVSLYSCKQAGYKIRAHISWPRT